MSETGGRSLLGSWAWWTAVVAGTLLRAVGLWRQIPIGDEVHAFHAVLALDFPEVLWTYRAADHCIPLTALLRLWMGLGVAPAEWMLRVPILAAGVALPVLASRWLERHVGVRPALVSAWVLALAPYLILYSRTMRPYMPAALTGSVAVALFLRWWRSGERGALAVYSVLAAGTIYLHVVFAPFVLAPFLFLLGETRGGLRRGERRLGEAVLAGVGIAALLALFLVPGWESFRGLLTEKSGEAAFGAITWQGAAILTAGSPARWLALLAWVLILRGSVLLARSEPLLARYGATLVLTQLVAVVFVGPFGAGAPVIFLRYNFLSLVPLLLVLGVGLAEVPRRWVTRPVRRGLVVAYLAACAVSHPLRDLALFTRGFGLSIEVFTFQRERPPWRLGRPAPYDWLDGQPGGAVVETPVRLFPNEFVRPLRAWSAGHGRRVYVSPGDARLRDPALGLDTVIEPSQEGLLAAPARFVVVHLEHERWLESGTFAGPFGERNRRRMRHLEGIGTRQARVLRRAFGPPDSEGDGVAIWDLARVRAAVSAAPG